MSGPEAVVQAVLPHLVAPEHAETRAELLAWLGRPHPPPVPPPRPLAPRRRLFRPAVCAARHGPAASVAAALAPLRHEMRWTDYAPSEWASAFVGRMATGILVGPDAPVADDRVAFGAFVVAPGTYYREHGHPARELYLALSGDPLVLSGRGWIELGAGMTSVQEPDVVHALRTGAEPALLFWVWTGAVDALIWGLDERGRRFHPPNLLPAA